MWAAMLALVIALPSGGRPHLDGAASAGEGDAVVHRAVVHRAHARRAPAQRTANREPASPRPRAPARRDGQAPQSEGQAPAHAGQLAERDDPRDSAGEPAERERTTDRRASGAPPPGPPIDAVLAAAYAAAGLDHDSQRSWNVRARLAGLVPWVTVRTTRDTSWQDQQSEVGHGTTVELRATWRLDRLLFDSRELQVAGIEASRRRERRRLATRVIRAYFAWRRAQAAASQAGDDERLASRAEEAIAELDALTDGWFSRQRARPASDAARAPGSAKP